MPLHLFYCERDKNVLCIMSLELFSIYRNTCLFGASPRGAFDDGLRRPKATPL